MKCLSLRQPWAWIVVHGGKRIENRRWSTRFRGPFLIHAAKGMTRAEYEGTVDLASMVAPGLDVPPMGELARGGIIGRAHLVDVLEPCPYDSELMGLCHHPWHMEGQFGFLLTNVEPLPFRPIVGHLGFFDVLE